MGNASDVETLDADTEATLLTQVSALGFDPNGAEVDGEVVRVEEDIRLDRDKLLAGDYLDNGEDGEEIEKGYKYGSLVSVANQGKIKLVFDTKYAPSDRIKQAFEKAALDWSTSGNHNLRIKTANTGPAITVKMLDVNKWPGVSGCGSKDAWACADIPANGRPGAVIWIRSAIGGSGVCDYTPTLLKAIALHELGHTIGLGHPKDTGTTHISGTMSCSGTAKTCAAKPNYETIMHAFIDVKPWPDCGAAGASTLQTDDRASIATVY